jgi:outer membrane protein OmpA-like peptidoglycan-associated protein
VIETDQGFRMRLNSVDFMIESSTLTPGGLRVLKRVQQILDRYDKYKVLIEGHTDEAGDDIKNLQLSEDRAMAVKDFLIEKGVNPERLIFRGFGETMPVYSNTTPESSRSNKRIEILLYR